MAIPPSNIYHHVVKVGNTVYIAGQLARDLEGRAMYPGDAEAQTRQAWVNLEIAVKAAGGTLTDIVKTNTYVSGPRTCPRCGPVVWLFNLPNGAPLAPRSWWLDWPTRIYWWRWRRLRCWAIDPKGGTDAGPNAWIQANQSRYAD
jgi:hypothetical protein